MAKQQNEELFETNSRGSVSVFTAVAFIVAFALQIATLLLSSYAFQAGLGADGLWLMAGAVLCSSLGFWIPFGLLPALGK